MLVNFPGAELSETKHKFRRRKKRVIRRGDHVFTFSKKLKLPITFGSSCRKWRLICYISPQIYSVIFSFPFWAPVTSSELSRSRCFWEKPYETRDAFQKSELAGQTCHFDNENCFFPRVFVHAIWDLTDLTGLFWLKVKFSLWLEWSWPVSSDKWKAPWDGDLNGKVNE